MKSHTTERFRKMLASLPDHVRQQAEDAYRLFAANLQHPGLRFKRVHSSEPIYSVRISLDYRAVGVMEEGAMIWFWIGSHADYDRLLRSLS